MKTYRFLSFILALVLVISLLPMSSLAAGKVLSGYEDAFHIQQPDGSFLSQFLFSDGTQVCIHGGKVIESTNASYTKGTLITKVEGEKGTFHMRHFHEFYYLTNRSGHGYECSCGARYNFVPHDDPATAEDGQCSCGYTYYTNAQITVLWFSGVTLSPRFHKDTYTYTGKLNRDIDEITNLTVKLFDEKATLEQPESLKLKKGSNVFEFTVTAEDGKTTQTYTVTIEK